MERRTRRLPVWSVALALLLGACGDTQAGTEARVTREPFGMAPDGQGVELITLTNARGMELRAMTYGGIIVSLKVPDRAGVMGDVVLGFDSLTDYVKSSPYFGALVGRYANRIAKGTFTLDGRSHVLAVNNGPNALHGGLQGFDKVVWAADTMHTPAGVGIRFHYVSKDGEEGYPGTLTATVTYVLTDSNEVQFEYTATTDKATPVNLTQHSYFNLAGSGDILGHVLTMPADRFVPVDATLIPIGALLPVRNTPFDFTTPHAVGERISASDEQLTRGRGYDHTFVLNRADTGLVLAAVLVDPSSGRTLEIRTTEPGVQFYSGNFLDGTLTGKGGTIYKFRTGLALETHHFPDSPNHPSFPNTILRPGDTFHSRTVWTFGVKPASAR